MQFVHATLLLSAVAGPLRAQQLPLLTVPLDSGRLIQAHVRAGGRVQGRLLRPFAPDGSALLVCRYPAPPCRTFDRAVAVPAVSVARLEVRTGSRWRHGALIGGLIGVGVGLITERIFGGLCDAPDCPSAAGLAITGGVTFGAFGALFGSQAVVWGPAP